MQNDDEPNKLLKTNIELNKMLRTLEKEKELVNKRNKILNDKKYSSLEKIKLNSLNEEKIKLIRVDMINEKFKEEKMKKDSLFNLKKQISLNYSMRIKMF